MLCDLYIACEKEGLLSIDIHYVGGLWVWIEFNFSLDCAQFMSNNSLKDLVFNVKPVSNGFLLDGRLIWVDINGLPLLAWTKACFENVVHHLGDVMFWDGDKKEGLASGRLCVKTKSMARVEEVLAVEINGNIYNTHIHEIVTCFP